jgi:hypothetical protein
MTSVTVPHRLPPGGSVLDLAEDLVPDQQDVFPVLSGRVSVVQQNPHHRAILTGRRGSVRD